MLKVFFAGNRSKRERQAIRNLRVKSNVSLNPQQSHRKPMAVSRGVSDMLRSDRPDTKRFFKRQMRRAMRRGILRPAL